MGPFDFLGLFAAEPGEDEETSAVSRSVAKSKEKFRVSQERANLQTKCLCKSLLGRRFKKGNAIGWLPDQISRYCSCRIAHD